MHSTKHIRGQIAVCHPSLSPYTLHNDEFLRDDFSKHRALPKVPWHSADLFFVFAETDHIGVFWAETSENNVKIFLKNFRLEIWREIENEIRKYSNKINFLELTQI